ncbi:hypothetical protein H0H93_010647 [Arthromyces matolae]|nr:hypothetical protein H0H93_010647 [Arthromyces matolae]
MPATSWWRAHFHDHPGWDERRPNSIANPQAKPSGHKPKVICIKCLDKRVTSEEQKDDEEIRNVMRQVKRTRAIIESECVLSLLSSCEIDLETDNESNPTSGYGESADSLHSSIRPRSLRSLINPAVNSEEEDDDNMDSISFDTIADLFDFDNSQNWSDYIKEYSLMGLDKELELYELVEMDAEGDDDIEESLDSMTEAALSI